MFVKDGGIIPMIGGELQRTETLEIRHYGKTESSFILYDDDSISFDYEKGVFSRIQLRARRYSEGNWVGEMEKVDGNMDLSPEELYWRFMTQE